ncbi:MAG: hypothetical protein GEU83_06870 [Pseudonocardiaceae bacterium]|nr:hypothetical protein [Pseudonocardiaceae bacterium]
MDQPSSEEQPTETTPSGANASGDVVCSVTDAYQALRDNFVVNANRGDNAANDDLIAAALQALRAPQTSSDGRR